MVQAYILIQTEVGKAREVALRSRSRRRGPRRCGHRSLRCRGAHRGPQRGRTRQDDRQQRAVGSRHHPHADLLRRSSVMARSPGRVATLVAVPAAVLTGASCSGFWAVSPPCPDRSLGRRHRRRRPGIRNRRREPAGARRAGRDRLPGAGRQAPATRWATGPGARFPPDPSRPPHTATRHRPVLRGPAAPGPARRPTARPVRRMLVRGGAVRRARPGRRFTARCRST